MKFLKFLFGIGDKYAKRTRDYTKNGYASRIGCLLFGIMLGVFAILLCRFGIPFGFEHSAIIGILMIFASIAAIPAAVSENFVMAAVAIRTFFRGVTIKAIEGVTNKVIDVAEDKIDKMEQSTETVNNGEQAQIESESQISGQEEVGGTVIIEDGVDQTKIIDDLMPIKKQKIKSYRLFDLFASILFIAIGVGTVFGVFVVGINGLRSLDKKTK